MRRILFEEIQHFVRVFIVLASNEDERRVISVESAKRAECHLLIFAIAVIRNVQQEQVSRGYFVGLPKINWRHFQFMEMNAVGHDGAVCQADAARYPIVKETAEVLPATQENEMVKGFHERWQTPNVGLVA